MDRAFRSFDRDGSGLLASNEFGAALKSLGLRLRPRQLQELAAYFDAGPSGGCCELDFPPFFLFLFSLLLFFLLCVPSSPPRVALRPITTTLTQKERRTNT